MARIKVYDTATQSWVYADKSFGKDGTSVTVKSVVENAEDGGVNVVTFSDGTSLNVKNGSKGSTGATPVKGIDYWTDADQESIVQQVIVALGTPVFGTVDAENNIILTGELVDGTYTISFEKEDGSFALIGTYNKSSELPNVFNPDTALLNTRLSTSSGETKSCDGVCVTDYIPFTLDGSSRRLTLTGGEWWTNAVQNSVSKWISIGYYDGSKNKLECPQFAEWDFNSGAATRYQFYKVDNGVYTTDIGNVGTTSANASLVSFASDVQYIRIAIGVSTTSAITKDDITDIKLTIAEAV